MKVLLIHGAGASPRNAGDDAQAFAAEARLKQVIPGCIVIKSRIYREDDATLWPGENLIESPHIYLLGSSRFTRIILGFLSRIGLRRFVALLSHSCLLRRVCSLLFASWCTRHIGINPLLDSTGRQVIQTITEVDAVYCSGGGNLNDTWLRTELLPRTVTYRVAHALGKPVVVSGQGVGPLHSRVGKGLIKWGTRHCILFGCRDKGGSEKLLQSIGVDQSIIESLGDDATDMVPAPSVRARQILEVEGCPVGDIPIIAFHVRFTNFTEDFRAQGIPFVASLCDKLIESLHCHILFVPISHAKDRSYDSDIGDAFEVYSKMINRNSTTFLCRHPYSPPEIKAVIAEATALVGFSYHAWIFSLTSGRPAFGLFKGDYFRLKSSGIFAWYQKEDWIWDIDVYTPHQVASVITETLKCDNNYGDELNGFTSQLVTNISKPAKRLTEVLRKSHKV